MYELADPPLIQFWGAIASPGKDSAAPILDLVFLHNCTIPGTYSILKSFSLSKVR